MKNLKKSNIYIICFFSFIIGFIQCKNEKLTTVSESYVNHVDPFIGTGGHGHTYPGATVPFGMLQVSPDNGISGWDWCSGYHYSDSLTIGFSHLHLSGTGIGDLADIRLMPVNKKVNMAAEIRKRDDVPYKSRYYHGMEKAIPGYYSVYLNDYNIKAELTSSQRTAFHKYTYNENDDQTVVLDLGYTMNWDKTLKGSIRLTDKYTVSGYRFSKGWANNQKVFYSIKFSKPIVNQKIIKNDSLGETRAQLFFEKQNSTVLQVKVALSSVSVENAEKNMMDTPLNFDFESIKNKAQETWEGNLSRIKVEGANDSLKKIFYTSLYHTQVSPVTFSDVSGDVRKENDSITSGNDFTVYSTLSLWDTFRAQHPLLTILEPERVTDMVKSMLLYYEVKKVLPVWTLYGNETNTMTGYHSIPVIAESYLKGNRSFDIEKAYEAMKVTMMQDERGVNYYKEYGYVPYDLLDESVTITLEYAYNDWCVAQIAKELGKNEDYEFFLNRSKAYKFLFDKETGFMRGKSKDKKSWNTPFDPKHSNHREHTDYTEGNAWQHSWFVLHDVPELIKMHGGEKNFQEKLEQLFTESSEITGDNISADITGLIGQYAHGNEPSHHIAYMFNYAKQPWRTQYWVREILRTQYNTTPNGLSGNEDCGQMSAWYVFSAIGLYPYNPASGKYQIGSPMFNKITLDLGDSKVFTILADNASEENIYIQSATLNGKPLNRTYINHEEIINGGELHFIMSNKPNKNWGI
ncbi:GH92 family glycosyl hydrolase [Tenacibaculum xiamenense]|uniref:GH92 family glycosyl hydrolase n=1 Tax=Tenacibaculum xiamenense TaxID=1261553 RepID=UPI0038961FFB